MKRLNSKTVSPDTVNHLVSKQTDVDGQAAFGSKANRANTLWKNKTESMAGNAAFSEIREILTKMCVGIEGCNYCEGNEARDIEHIYPKSLFPEKAFQWSNYLLACKTCNMDEKVDRFAVFNPIGSANKELLARGVQPANDDTALIDPRSENPEEYLWLDIIGDTFLFEAIPNDDLRYTIKAEYTIELLSLNDRDNLIEARRAAANHFQNELKRYVAIKTAVDFNALEAQVNDPELINEAIPFEDEKNRILASVKKNILTYAHPTVWLELKRQRDRLPRTKKLFDLAPEALYW